MALGGTFEGVVIDSAALAAAERQTPGLLRYQLVIGEKVKSEARRRVGVHRLSPGEIRKRKPGTLRDTIVKRVVERDGFPVVLVGSEDEIALLHHEGTQPHEIRPRRGRVLVFYSADAGRLVIARVVHHPGTKPNRFLTDSLAVIGRES